MIFNNIYDRLGKLMFSQNDHIVAIILTLLYEVFSECWSYNDISEWVLFLLPKIVSISARGVYNSSIAMEILNRCANNMFLSEAIIALLHTLNENHAICENAYITLRYLIQNADPNFLMEQSWDNIFEEIIELFTINYEIADRFCKILLEKFTREELLFILSNTAVEDDALALILDLFGFKHKDRVEIFKLRNQ
jgi:hypothetical protein